MRPLDILLLLCAAVLVLWFVWKGFFARSQSVPATRASSVLVRRLPPEECDGLECWTRETTDSDIEGVEASLQGAKSGRYWQVDVSVMTLVRDVPLESEMRAAIASALEKVSGAASVHEQDREIWVVTGTPSGKELVQATASAVDLFASRARKHLEAEQ